MELEATLPFYVLLLSAALAALWEAWAPRDASAVPLRARWLNNGAVWVVDTLLARWMFPALGVAFALIVERRGWGLLHAAAVPAPIAIGAAILALDLARYAEHWLYHRVPVLWRLHRLHHTDTAFDFTLGLRFHPGEALASAAVQVALIAALGIAPLAVLAYQLLSLASSLLAHANARLPDQAEGALRRVVVTPDMHRIHHSAMMDETNSNLGNLFPWWDRLFGTYVAEPAGGHAALVVGLERFRGERDRWLPWMLLNPFARG